MMLVTQETLNEMLEVMDEKIDEELDGNPEGLSLLDLMEQDKDSVNDMQAVLKLVRAFTAPLTHENASAICESIKSFVEWYNATTAEVE